MKVLIRTLASLFLLRTVSAQIPITTEYNPPQASTGRDSSAPQWNNLLGNSLFYYDAQRAGKLPDNYRVQWRNDSVLGDGQDVKLDLSAGYFDAGNMIKVTLPLSWAVSQIAWSATLWGRGFESASQTAYLDEVLRNGLDWLMEATSVNTSIVVQVGTTKDNYWGGDRSIPLPRPSYYVSVEKPGTDVVASTAAAFAAGYLLYSGTALPLRPDGKNSKRGTVPTSLQDTNYAQTLLTRAQSLFALAQSAQPQQVAQRVVPALSDSYPSSDWRDKLAFAGALLTIATGDANLANQTMTAYTDLHMPQIGAALNWDARAPAISVLMTQAAVMHPELNLNLTRFQSDSEAWLDSFADGSASKGSQVSFTPGGLAWFSGYSSTSSLNPALNAAAIAQVYSGFATGSKKENTYLNFAQSQLDYALGDNPMNAVYVVGQSPNSAENPHSALASGGTNINNIDNSPPVEAYVLYGALVGGPDHKDQYYDTRSDYAQTEPALDLQAALVFLTASQVANSTAGDPFYVTLTSPRLRPTRGGDNGGGGNGISQAGGIAIAVVVLVVVFVGGGALAWWKRDSIRYWWRHK
ncbi:hypothetical protein A4X13_0g3026 [Tilletia indica]|uniref:cellulase n=1 Tax=Tilletia indica TaxID=43049 RepID=A0A177TGU5_9BASI|nr:hypothetical protein A4X13_0g3026 [Tilletia indica]